MGTGVRDLGAGEKQPTTVTLSPNGGVNTSIWAKFGLKNGYINIVLSITMDYNI
jgi:hypothetical protein